MTSTATTNAKSQDCLLNSLNASIGNPLLIAAGELIDPPHLPGWHGVKLKAELQAAFSNLPVFIEQGGNAGALAEFHFGGDENAQACDT